MKWVPSIVFTFVIFLGCAPLVYAAEPVYTEGALEYRIEDGGIVITGYFGDSDEVVIPREIAGLPVSEVSEGAFAGSPVTNLTLPDTIMKISENAAQPSCQIVFSGEAVDESKGQEQEESRGDPSIPNNTAVTEVEVVLESSVEITDRQTEIDRKVGIVNGDSSVDEAKKDVTIEESNQEETKSIADIQLYSKNEERGMKSDDKPTGDNAHLDDSNIKPDGEGNLREEESYLKERMVLVCGIMLLVIMFTAIILKKKRRKGGNADNERKI